MGFAEIQLLPGPDIARPTISITLGQELDVVLALVDDAGHPVDLTAYVAPYEEEPVTAPCRRRTPPLATGISIVARSHRAMSPPDFYRPAIIEGEPCEGRILIPFESCDFTYPGIYLGEVGLFLDSRLQQAYPIYLEVAPSLHWRGDTAGPLTIPEVRLWLRDNHPDDNILLDEVEFKDAEIIAAIRRAVDIWNSTPPLMARFTFSPVNFPYRSQWIDLTIALLKGMAYHWLLRNELPYSAGGISIDDKNKWKVYLEESRTSLQLYTQWVQMIKPQLNAGQAWGRVGYVPLP